MSPIVNSMIMSLVRKALVMLGTWLVSNGLVGQQEWETQVAGLAAILVGAGWSLYNKWKAKG